MLDRFLQAAESLTPLIAALAWPVVVLVVFLLLRGTLRDLLSRLNRLKHGELEAQFSSGLQRATSLAPDVLNVTRPEEVTPQIDDADRVEALFRLAKVSARGAVMDAWRELELAAIIDPAPMNLNQAA